MPPRKKSSDFTPTRFHQVLHHLGWSIASLPAPQPLEDFHWQAAALPGGQNLLLVHLRKDLPILDSAFRQYDDLCPFHRQLQATLKAAGIHERHLVVVDPHLGAQLIDSEQEDILLDVRGEDDMASRLLPLLDLNSLARGSLAAFPRKSVGQRARELNEWTELWSARLGAAATTNREMIRRVFQWLHLARLAEEIGLVPQRVPGGFTALIRGEKSKNVLSFITKTLRPLARNANLLQGIKFEVVEKILAVAHTEGQLTPCLESFALLARSKFSSGMFAEAFADDELKAIGWRQSIITNPAADSEDPQRWLSNPAIIGVDSIGLPLMLRHYGQVVEDLRQVARDQAIARERGERPGLQLDLLSSEPPLPQEDETPCMALQLGLRVETRTALRAEVARLVLLANAAEWQAKLRPGLPPVFPTPEVSVLPEGKSADAPKPIPRPATKNAHLN